MNRNVSVRHLLLPLFYFFFLSLATVATTSYWFLRLADNGISKTYAQTEDSLPIKITISAGDDTRIKMNYPGECNNPIANKIDNYFESKNAPLAGEGCNFVYYSDLYGIEPILLAAIAQKESSGGKTTPQFQGKESYNPFGWAVFDNNAVTKAMNAYGYDSWADCIDTVARGISRKADRGLSPEDIVQWYNPGSVRKADGDPKKSAWAVSVRGFMSVIDSFPER